MATPSRNHPHAMQGWLDYAVGQRGGGHPFFLQMQIAVRTSALVALATHGAFVVDKVS